jgi:hypothetical protein
MTNKTPIYALIVSLKNYLNIHFYPFVLKNMDMCHNFNQSLCQNSAFIYINIYDNIKRKQEKIKRKIERERERERERDNL